MNRKGYDNMEEIWKEISDLHGRYEVSTFGRIRNTITKHIKAQQLLGTMCN